MSATLEDSANASMVYVGTCVLSTKDRLHVMRLVRKFQPRKNGLEKRRLT